MNGGWRPDPGSGTQGACRALTRPPRNCGAEVTRSTSLHQHDPTPGRQPSAVRRSRSTAYVHPQQTQIFGEGIPPKIERMAKPSREHILGEVRRLAEDNGSTPLGKERFESLTGITEAEWSGRHWARWSDLVREAGYEPNAWQGKTYDDETLIRLLADVTRALGRIPTAPELRLWRRTNDPQMPNDKVFSNRLGLKSEQTEKVRVFARSHPDYADVAAICEAATARVSPSKVEPADQVVTGAVYLIQMREFHKIGKSNDPDRRNYELGLQLPEKHDLVHIITTDDPSGIEAYWHRRFSHQRANGEWFRLAPADVAAFRRRTYM